MIFQAPEAPLAIPEVPLTTLLLERAAGWGDKPALVDGPSGRTLTYRGWSDAVRRTAAGLARRGFGKGDVFAIYSPNLPEYAVALHAVSLAGGITTTINPLYTVHELVHQLRDAGARALITVGPFLDKARQAAHESGIGDVFVLDGAEGATSFASLQDAEAEPPAVPIHPLSDVVVLPYSSGTTGLPKGVMLTHYNIVANLLQGECALGLTAGDTLLGVLPFYHIYGMVVIMSLGLYVGATVVTLPRFDLEQCLALIEKHRITFANVVPPIVLALAKQPAVEGYDLSSLRTVFSGAAPLGENVAMAASARLGCRVVQGYGLTETAPITHATRVGADRARAAGVGPPLPNTEVKVVDVSSGAELGPNQEGEICIRGPQVMKGYLGRPDATAAMIDLEGWLHTGDVGYADEDGCFFVVDRVKELIKYKGLQIAPAELEAVLLSHPDVADAAVVPVPDEEAGQVPKGFVVLKREVLPAHIESFVAERVAPYKKLRALEITDAIPRSPSGKVLRRLLAEREKQRVAARAAGVP